MPERFRGEFLTMGRYTKLYIFFTYTVILSTSKLVANVSLLRECLATWAYVTRGRVAPTHVNTD